VKHILLIIVLFYGHLCLIDCACYGNRKYTIQIAASKTPIDVEWLSSQYQIDREILEIKEDRWYKHLIGEFESNQLVSDYVAQDLQLKGLQDSFPRLIPDTVKEVSAKKIKSAKSNITTENKGNSAALSSHPTSSERVSSVKTGSSQSGKQQNSELKKPLEKYKVWEKLVGWQSLQRIEIKLIEGAKIYLPRSVVPFYVRMIDRAIRFPVILFFMMLIFLFVLNAILIMVILEVSNTLKNQVERYNILYQEMYERALTGFLFQEYDIEAAVSRVKKIHRRRNRKIFVSVLFNFQKNLSGDSDQKILEIFFRLKLNEDAIKKTKSHSFYRQILGLRELTNLYPSGALPVVVSNINDDNDELRAEAQTSYVRLDFDEPFGFMRNLRKPYTRWTQMTAFYIFKLHKLPAPDFSEYLQSELYNIQNFSLRMITHFQQKENAGEIIELLYAERNQTRFLAIKAISELGIQEAKPMLKYMYENETFLNKIEILKALLNFGDIDDFEFLEKIIRGNNVSLKIEACRSMYFMNTSGMENLLRLSQEKELALEPYIAHIYDSRN
jgi:hypothetical protein